MTASRVERVVLVVAGRDDLFSDKIILSLQSRGVDAVRLDLSAAPLRMDCVLTDAAWHGVMQARNGRPVRLEQVTSVLWRWGGKIPGHPDIADEDQRAWAAQEDTEAALGVLRSLPAYWMSHPDRLAAVEGNKPTQLRDAARAGLTVPRTLITSDGTAANAWMRPDTPHIYKAFRAPYKPRHGTPGWVLATRIRGPLPDELCAASIVQELIHGTPIRMTVIGGETFAVAVKGISYDVDWRPHQTDAALQPVAIPDGIGQAIRRLMAEWGLSYGTLDFIDTGDDWVFLEVNALGAYGFVEEATGLPLTRTIAETLARGKDL
ncbi:ATP-grasp ribosomal peptide maturase [Actinoallomurus oryzae]|uniref:ATP-grasp ribosomal peptide maturase n=1 Tax=Actinoallomurus oryzae TaxID=502180 RepID=A0ABP8PNK9_9ACTN